MPNPIFRLNGKSLCMCWWAGWSEWPGTSVMLLVGAFAVSLVGVLAEDVPDSTMDVLWSLEGDVEAAVDSPIDDEVDVTAKEDDVAPSLTLFASIWKY